MLRDLKRTLIFNGFTIENDDSSSGILVTKAKPLMADEKINADFAMALAGASMGQQYGSISFIYETLQSGAIKLQMICRLQYEAKYHENIYKDRDISNAIDVLPQGHPFPMKIKNLLLQNSNFKHIDL